MLAAKKLYGMDVQCEGPRVERIRTMGGQGRTVVLELGTEAVVPTAMPVSGMASACLCSSRTTGQPCPVSSASLS